MDSKSFYVNIESDLLFDNRISSTTKIIYAIISNYSNNKDGYCYLKYSDLSQKLGICKRSLYYHVFLLKKYEYLTVLNKNNRSYLMPIVNIVPKERQNKKENKKELYEYDWLNENVQN